MATILHTILYEWQETNSSSTRRALLYGLNLWIISFTTLPWVCHIEYTVISMVGCKTIVTPMLTHWSYNSLALSHRYQILVYWKSTVLYFPVEIKYHCNDTASLWAPNNLHITHSFYLINPCLVLNQIVKSRPHFADLVQDYCNSRALTMESCTKQWICCHVIWQDNSTKFGLIWILKYSCAIMAIKMLQWYCIYAC